jgi:hypothetical protein
VILTENNFKNGESVVCILNNRASLTVGKEYVIVSEPYNRYVEVVNDEGEWADYDYSRFLPKSEWRKFKIDLILE